MSRPKTLFVPRRTFVMSMLTMLTMLLLAASAALAQDPNVCDEPGESPNVLVGELHQLSRFGSYNGITAYSVGTVSCNVRA